MLVDGTLMSRIELDHGLRPASETRHESAPETAPEATPDSPRGDESAHNPAGDLLAGLNPPQRDAVVHGEGPLLILAGPGSGKTRVITRRIAHLITELDVAPWRILAITFTNKAAREMRERVEALLPGVQGLWISTFHSMCARILRREIGVLPGYTRDFSIYDTQDKNQLLKTLIKDAGYDITRFKPSMVGGWISERKNAGCGQRASSDRDADARAEQRAIDALEDLSEEGIEHEVLVKVEKLYAAALAKQNALDFDDLLLKVLEIFERHPGVRDAYASRFLHVMVDEYQDTNRVQYLLTRHLSSVHRNLAVCGDPDQSIYAWRGADIRNILDFEEDFGAPRVVKLEQNYRSTGTILKAAQAVISKNRARKSKTIWTAAEEGRRVVALCCSDENDEAREIADQIRSLAVAGVPLSEVAVFYRVNFMQRALESALRRAALPYQIVGGVEFYERREIRDLVAYLKLIVNPLDDVAFRRVVNVPARGIGERTIELLSSWAADRRVSLMQALQSEEALKLARGKARVALEDFRELMARLAPFSDQDAALAIDQVLDEIDYDAWMREMEDASGVDREANVDELRAHAEEFDRRVSSRDHSLAIEAGVEPVHTDATRNDVVRAETLLSDAALAETEHDDATRNDAADGPAALAGAARDDADAAAFPAPPLVRGLRGFLQEIALVSDTDDMETGREKVTLMTLHSAKGLEYSAVFIAGVEEELLPHVRAITESAGASEDAGVEEERRLFYVGITRAKERLFLMHARERLHFGQQSWRTPSRFLEEIPPELVEGFEPDRDEEEMLGKYDPTPSIEALREGDRVQHDHFGAGIVERLQGSGVNARATVRFAQHGSKLLLLQYAKLKVIGKGAR
jgi:DNA helicase-2/ATP-dependent DNA helicase PcrA